MKNVALLLAALLLPMAPGCQCFTPVSDQPDASVDAGGRDAGPVAECARATDCGDAGARACFFAGGATRSCLDGRCVFDCLGPRACRSSNGTCLVCDGGTTTCGSGCVGLQAGATGRIARDCGNSFEELGGFSTRYAQGATCNFVVSNDAGVTLEIDAHGDGDLGVATVSEEPGVTCSMTVLQTALERVVIGCGRCVYLLEWP